jgi:hypothetical protein
MSIVWVSIFGKLDSQGIIDRVELTLLRANRAQFADVYLRHIDEDEEVPEIGVPTVQGITDNTGKLMTPLACETAS